MFNIVRETKKGELHWARHVWRKDSSIIQVDQCGSMLIYPIEKLCCGDHN